MKYEKILFRRRFLLLLICMLAMFLLNPLLRYLIGLRILFDAFITIIIISGIYAVGRARRMTLAAVCLAVPMLLCTWSALAFDYPVLHWLGEAIGIVFFVYLIILGLMRLVRAARVTAETIDIAVVVYLLLALTWGFGYSLLAAAQPGAFVLPEEPAGSIERFTFLYFSLVTITTLGYGDIVPVTPFARMLACLEAMLGQIYLVVIIARLVGLQVSQQSRHFTDSEMS